MLTRIIDEFRKADGVVDLNELSRRLGVDRSALKGMLALLVHQGKLREVGASSEDCTRCAEHLGCAHQHSGNRLGMAYELVERK